MRTLALSGASCKRRSFFYCTGAACKSLRLLPLLMVEGYLGRSWAVWTGAMGVADELRMYGVLRSSSSGHSPKFMSDILYSPVLQRFVN
jgi:hypothetical protein